MELFEQIVNSFQPLTVYSKSYILDVWLGSKKAPLFSVNLLRILDRFSDFVWDTAQYGKEFRSKEWNNE